MFVTCCVAQHPPPARPTDHLLPYTQLVSSEQLVILDLTTDIDSKRRQWGRVHKKLRDVPRSRLLINSILL
jgi:hypothetical protein